MVADFITLLCLSLVWDNIWRRWVSCFLLLFGGSGDDGMCFCLCVAGLGVNVSLLCILVRVMMGCVLFFCV